MKYKAFILKVLILVIFILNSFNSIAVNYQNYELGLIDYNDNTFEFDITNTRDQPLDIKLNVIDTYNLVEVEFNEKIFELSANEQKHIIMTFDLSSNLKKSIENNVNYSFMIIPTIINKRDNSILILKNSAINPISPESIIIHFNVEKKNFSFNSIFSSIGTFLNLYLINIIIYIFLIGFIIYFVYEIIALKKNNKIKYHKIKIKKEHKKFTLNIKFPKFKKNLRKKENNSICEKINKSPTIIEKEKTHIPFVPQEKNQPQTYTEFIKEFVDKNNGIWTSAQFIKLLSTLKKNNINMKINKIKEDLENEKEHILSIKKTHSTIKETKKELNEIDNIRDKLKKLREKL